MSNSAPVAGFQFNVDGATITSATGGSAEANGFTVSNSASTVLGFSLTGSTIPAGEGVLVDLGFTGYGEVCLTDVLLSDPNASSYDVEIGGCFTVDDDNVYGCTDEGACNYDADATSDDGSCDYGTECWDGSTACDASDCPDAVSYTHLTLPTKA